MKERKEKMTGMKRELEGRESDKREGIGTEMNGGSEEVKKTRRRGGEMLEEGD